MILDYPWYFCLLCLLLGAAYAFVLYRKAPSRWRWAMAALRTLAVSAIAFLLLAPMARQRVHERQRPVVVLAQDASQSVTLSADSAFSLQPLADKLSDRCDIVLAPFSNGSTTDIGAALEKAASQGDVAAVVLASDGINNRGNSPTSVAERISCPIYTVALGDTTPQRDAAIGHLRYNNIAYLGNDFTLELTINASRLSGNNAQLTVAQAGRTLASQRISYSADDFSTTLSLTLPTSQPGLQRLSVDLSLVEGERSADNNHVAFYVDVIDSRQKVAIIANAPHPDLSALKNAIEANPNYEARIIFASDLHKTDFAKEQFSLAVLHNLPSATNPTIRNIDHLPQIHILGAQTDLPRFNALHTGLEVVTKLQGKTNEVTALHQPSFTLFTLDDPTAETIENMPPLNAPAGTIKTSSACQTLFTARVGTIDSRQPLIAATSQGKVRRAFVCGEGLWRWRLAEYGAHSTHTAFDRLISQLVVFTAQQSNRDRLHVEAERLYPYGDPIVIQAQLYNEAYEPINTPDVSLSIESATLDKPLSYTFAREGDAYRLQLPNLDEGIYRYTARTTLDGTALSATGSFAVEALNLETRNMVADHSLLNTISQTTGGIMVRPADLNILADSLAAIRPAIYSHTRYAEFLRMPLILALILLMMAAEWVIRKYNHSI